MVDQLIIGDKASFDDYGASIASRKIGQPKKKSIKETLPYSNETYDFSAINGEVYWEERELEYTFEMTAENPEELEEMKTAFADWVMNIMKEDISDPFYPFHHFVGTFSEMEFDDDEGIEKTTATVKFAAYPYKIANMEKVYTFTIPKNSDDFYIDVVNESSHRILPTVYISGEIVITGGDWGKWSEAIPAGTYEDDKFLLKRGLNSFTVQNPNESAIEVRISFFEEVL